jgi:hypothetical protein
VPFLLAPRMSCQARVLNEEKQLPVSHEVYHTTKECGQEASHVELIDDGDAEMKLCTCCTRRYKANDSWYGFFDCRFPPMARIFGSDWYYEMMRLEDIESDVEDAEEEEEEEQEDAEDEVPVLELPETHAEDEVPVLELPETLSAEEEEVEAPPPEVEEITEIMKVSSIIDKKEEISQKIKTLKTQLKNPRLDIKIMQAYNKEIIELRTTLRKMK